MKWAIFLEQQNKTNSKTTFISVIAVTLTAVLGLGILGFEYYDTSKQNQKLREQISSIKKENSSLINDVSSKIKVIDGLNTNNDKLNSTLNEQKKINSTLNSQINDLKNQLNTVNSELSKLKGVKATPSKTDNNNLAYYKAANTGPKICYLTFDDGPSDNTLKILNSLKAGNAKATFFVVGTAKLSYIKNINAEGHSIGLHTDTHEWSIYKTEATYFADLISLKGKIKNIIGKEVNIIRFPGGSSNKVSANYNKGIMTRLTKSVLQKGFSYFDWNVDSLDASGNRVAVNKMLDNIKKESKNKKEICLLMHDTSSKNTTVEALPYIISYLRSQGFRFEPLTEKSNGFHHGRLSN